MMTKKKKFPNRLFRVTPSLCFKARLSPRLKFRLVVRDKLLCEQARSPSRAARERASERSRLLSRASRASTFHDSPQMESLLES